MGKAADSISACSRVVRSTALAPSTTAGNGSPIWDAIPSSPVSGDTANMNGIPLVSCGASLLPASPRSAANPANALLNYLYAILEAQARIAILSIGLDPGMGVLHADLKARDSLALDVMEPVRPEVDRFVLELLRSHTFAAREFFETRQGACRILPPLTHQLAEMTPRWIKAIAPVAEAI